MPLFQIGYRRYEGGRTSDALRWLPITRSGLTIAWRSKLLRRLVYTSFLPFLYFGFIFFLVGRATEPSSQSSRDILDAMITPGIGDLLMRDPAAVRSIVWAMVFATFGNVQVILGIIVATLVGPPLIAKDMRTRAFLIYFARPVSRLDYVLGKAGVLAMVVAWVSLIPSLCVYGLSILFSPSLDVIAQTAPVALATIGANLAMVIPMTLVTLAISSLTRQPRFAAAFWIVFCAFGPIAHSVLQVTRELRGNGWTFLMSLPHSIRTLQLGLYDVGGRAEELGFSAEFAPMVNQLSAEYSPLRAGVWLLLVSAFCLALLLRRVDAPTRV